MYWMIVKELFCSQSFANSKCVRLYTKHKSTAFPFSDDAKSDQCVHSVVDFFWKVSTNIECSPLIDYLCNQVLTLILHLGVPLSK